MQFFGRLVVIAFITEIKDKVDLAFELLQIRQQGAVVVQISKFVLAQFTQATL